MKHQLSIFFIFCFNPFFATSYYLSNGGNDTNTGISYQSPWKTIDKLNSITYMPGDTIFLNSGDIFKGSLQINQGGTLFSPVVITSYGTLSKPVITGADTLQSWIQNGNIYYKNTTLPIKNFFVNNKEMTVAREPNEGSYLWLDSAKTNYLKDAQLTDPIGYWDSAKICIHTAQWCWEKTSVQSYSPGLINYTDPTEVSGINGYAYFFYDKTSLLDTALEWRYDSTNQVIYYFPPVGQNPNTLVCETTTLMSGIEISNGASYIQIKNLAFEKQYEAGIIIGDNSTNVIISNCDFFRQYNYGIEVRGTKHTIENCTLREIDGIGIIINNGSKDTLRYNTLRNIGQFRNSGVGKEINLSAITLTFIDSSHIHHNTIDSTGYCGISADGSYNIIERNIIKNAMRINNDGAALKSFGIASQYNIFRNNFVSESNGNKEGTKNGSFLTPGIYFDFSTNHCRIENNTIYNQNPKGIFQNSGTNNNTIIGNVIYGSSVCIDLNGNPIISTPITNDTIKHNVFFALTPQTVLMRQVDYTYNFNYGMLDSNYYFHPYDANKIVLRIDSPTTNYYDFNTYQTISGVDQNSISRFLNWTYPTDNSRLFMNQTDSISTINLGDTLFLDMDSNIVYGNIQIQPYSSKILINTGTLCATSVKEKTSNANFFIYPNPANDRINIIQTKPGNFILKIYDIAGREIISSSNSNAYYETINIPEGIYLLQIKQGNDQFSQRIIIKR